MAEVMDKPVESQHQTAVRRFNSPNRILARSFRLSRDKWKQKHKEAKAKIKYLEVRSRDLEKSREHWREIAEEHEQELEFLKEENARLRCEVEEAEQVQSKKRAAGNPT